MTERWRKRLGDLDKQNPSEDLFERARGGPQLPDEPISRPSTSTRIVTGIAAFLVFALAISVFAIPALRLKGSPHTAFDLGAANLPLWPARTLDAAQQLQAEEDDAPSYLADAGKVARAFGSEVMGWTDFQVSETPPEVASTTVPYGAPCDATYRVGCVSTGPVPSTTTSPGSSPYRGFRLSRMVCSGDVCSGSTEYLLLFQPVREGDGGVWMVLSARGDIAALATPPGADISAGDSISSLSYSSRGVVLGYHAGAGDCTELRSTTADWQSWDQPSGAALSGAYSSSLVVALDPRPECSHEEPGYVFAATLEDGSLPSDGFDPLVVAAPISQLTAVPVTFIWPEETQTSISPSPEVVRWTRYTDPLGWSIDVPKNWVTQTIDGSDARVSYQGAAFGSAPLERAPGGPTTISPPPGEVMLMITHREGGPADIPADDSTFPLAYEDLSQEEGGLTGIFRGDGLPFDLVIRFADVTDQQVEILRHMVGSIGFKSWQFGGERNGWVSLHDPSTDNAPDRAAHISWQQCDNTGCFVLVYGGDGPYGLGPIQTCGEGENMTADPTSSYPIVLECPSGPAQSWADDGTPDPTNQPGDDVPLDHHPVIRAWDGTLLMNPSNAIG